MFPTLSRILSTGLRSFYPRLASFLDLLPIPLYFLLFVLLFFLHRANEEKPKSASLACFLSFLYPGLGHVYIGEWITGVLYLLFFFVVRFISTVLPLLIFYGGLIPLIYIAVSAWDAYKSALSFNQSLFMQRLYEEKTRYLKEIERLRNKYEK